MIANSILMNSETHGEPVGETDTDLEMETVTNQNLDTETELDVDLETPTGIAGKILITMAMALVPW